MLAGFKNLRWPHFAVGAALLTGVSLNQMYSVVRERADRADVLAHGREAQARVLKETGVESVLLEWIDEDGRRRTGESNTGKPFARTSSGATAAIKYDSASNRNPVILSEVPERERVNDYWFESSLWTIAGVAAVSVASVFSTWRATRPQAGASPK
ncbi:MAG: hypothetical protein BGP06_11930 [Rhizobiales bacterium 65-9]|nr:hypothetical protein [Hyphomicrobiales bacterium]OJY33981.1 MAG: hypothetical protein BGP06_11930 [Rhizobiales bacterium 65-9]